MSTAIFRLAVICSAVALCVPVADAALVPLSNIVMVKAGISYSLALKSDGTVLAWGDNSGGQLGDGTSDTRLTPVHVTCGAATADVGHCSLDGHLKGVSQIAAGAGISLALLDSGAVMAWGANSKFKDGSTNSITPVYVVWSRERRRLLRGAADKCITNLRRLFSFSCPSERRHGAGLGNQ